MTCVICTSETDLVLLFVHGVQIIYLYSVLIKMKSAGCFIFYLSNRLSVGKVMAERPDTYQVYRHIQYSQLCHNHPFCLLKSALLTYEHAHELMVPIAFLWMQ